jgi:hypothetical protein
MKSTNADDAFALTDGEVQATFMDLISRNYELLPAKGKTYGPRDWPASVEVEALEEAETHFDAPRPKQVFTAADPIRRAAIIVFAVLLILAVATTLLRPILGVVPPWVTFLGGAGLVACVAVMVWRLPVNSHDDDGAKL